MTGDRRLRDLPTTLARHPWGRLVPMLVAGAALVLPVLWVVHAASEVTSTRAVVQTIGKERSSARPATTDYTATAVTADGQEIDMGAAGAGEAWLDLGTGSPVVITRSAADGRVLLVRGPQTVVDVENHWGMHLLRTGGLVVVGGMLWMTLGAAPRPWAGAVAATVAGGLLTFLITMPRHDLGPYEYEEREAMQGFVEPPTRTPDNPWRSTFRVDRIEDTGTRVATPDGIVSVTGPPERGLPAGADPEVVRWFEAVRVPVRIEPVPGDPPDRTHDLPNGTLLLGEGRGWASRLDDPACAGAPGALREGTTGPIEGWVCFAVPDGFEPRYLVFRHDDVAVDLR